MAKIRFSLPPPNIRPAPHFRDFMITHTQDTPHSAGLLWTSDQLDAETSSWQHKQDKTSVSPAGFEPATPASE